MKLDHKHILITGGAGGIGMATAKLFLNEGASSVHLVDLDEKSLKNAQSELLSKGKVTYTAADVSTADGVQTYINEAVNIHGTIDVLFLNAGIEGVVKPIIEYPEEMYDKIMQVNVKGLWLGLKYAFPIMQKNGGSIIINSSVAGLVGTPNVSAYTTSKHAAIGVMKSGALEGAPNNIRVNSIHPSPVDNRMMRSLEEGFAPGAAVEAKKNFEQTIPLKRYAKNEDIAKLALFLASDDSSFITGAQYVIDGGMTT